MHDFRNTLLPYFIQILHHQLIYNSCFTHLYLLCVSESAIYMSVITLRKRRGGEGKISLFRAFQLLAVLLCPKYSMALSKYTS